MKAALENNDENRTTDLYWFTHIIGLHHPNGLFHLNPDHRIHLTQYCMHSRDYGVFAALLFRILAANQTVKRKKQDKT